MSHPDAPLPDSAWLPSVCRRLGRPAVVAARSPLAGGYTASAVERVELAVGGGTVAVVVKVASATEVAAMRALAAVPGLAPRPLAVGPGWLVLSHLEAGALGAADPVPVPVWDTLARVHAHWWSGCPRGVPVFDAAWWTRLCDRTLVAVRGGHARTGDPPFATAERALLAWRVDPALASALARLPRTLVHGDAHRGNILGTALIDWGNARVAPAGLDLATLRAQGSDPPAHYRAVLGRRPEPELTELERHWSDVAAHVQYLGFAADHLGATRVAEMVDVASAAHARLAGR